VRAFASHCGINSAHESIHSGTPIVAMPLFADQLDMALKLADAGCGLVLDKRSITADTLRSAIVRLMDDPMFRAPMPALRTSFEKAGAIRRAADLIEEAADSARRRIGRARTGAGPRVGLTLRCGIRNTRRFVCEPP
jgi:UDP:flavonoid glycosyltransferase YjiC (YdhE family)